MTARLPEPAAFYRERVPTHFNLSFEASERAAAAGDAAAQRALAGMRTVNATIRIQVEEDATYDLTIEAGRMSCHEGAHREPFMTLRHGLACFAGLVRESGDSVLGFLGALAGLQGDMKLTSQRVQNLRALSGCLRFELTGEQGFELTADFGASPPLATPTCCIRLDRDTYHALLRAEISAQDAFLGGRIEAEGDMQMLMRLALAVLSPE